MERDSKLAYKILSSNIIVNSLEKYGLDIFFSKSAINIDGVKYCGCGVDSNLSLVIEKTKSEIIERACAYLVGGQCKTDLYMSECELDKRSYKYVSRNNFTSRKNDLVDNVSWVKYNAYGSEEVTYYPALYTYPNWVPRGNEIVSFKPDVTGLACHVNHSDAIISSLSEIIEREALVLAWNYRNYPKQPIKIDSANPVFNGIDVFTESIFTDIGVIYGIPVIICILLYEGLSFIGSSASSNSVSKASEDAYYEALQAFINYVDGSYDKVEHKSAPSTSIDHLIFGMNNTQLVKERLGSNKEALSGYRYASNIEDMGESIYRSFGDKYIYKNINMYKFDIGERVIVRSVIPSALKKINGMGRDNIVPKRIRRIESLIGEELSMNEFEPHPFG